MIKRFVETLIQQLNIENIKYDIVNDTCQGNDQVQYTSGDIGAM